MAKPAKPYLPYMLLVATVGYGTLVLLSVLRWQEGISVSLLWKAGIFLALAILVGLHPVRLPRGPTTTVGFALDYACLLIFGPTLAAWVGVLSDSLLLWRSTWLRRAFNHGMLVLSFAGAGVIYEHLGGAYVEGAASFGSKSAVVEFGKLAPALAAGGVAYFVIASVLIATGMALWERRSVLGMWVLGFRWAAPRFLALAPFGLLMAMVYQIKGLGIWAVILFLAPLFGARYAFQGAMEMLEVHRETVYALSNALEAYDPYTRNHSELVTHYSLSIGRELGLSDSRLEVLEWACRLHDIGKCREDWEPIIRKPGKPSDAEWEVIKRHPIEGSRLAEKMEFLPHTAGLVSHIVRAHHERLDGTGYPDHQQAETISLEARILAVADAFEAMTAPRAYHRQRTAEDAIQELHRCAGKQFDVRVVEALAAACERGEVQVTAQPAQGVEV